MKILFSICIFLIIGCNINTNTSDPQASKNIIDSQKDGLFIERYAIDSQSCLMAAKQAWVEFSWRNKWNNGKIMKYKNGTRQLVLTFDAKSVSLDPYDYIWKWVISDSKYGTFRSCNGIYALDLPEKIIPPCFKISVYMIRPNKKDICDIFIKK
jgi:hypothetical protein